jgi:hypothetical protein
MISHSVDGNNQLSGTTQKHTGRCADCREFYQNCLSLAESLTREATISNREISKRLSSRILTALSGQETKDYKVTFKLRPIVTAACLVLAVLIGAYFLIPSRDDRDITESDPVAAFRRLAKEEFAPTWSEFIERPLLAGELNNITEDTESAVRFLVACVTVDIADIDSRLSPE